MQYIDIHNHFAWDIDDGMENEENCRIALENASKDGVSAIIATPHFLPGRQNRDDVEAMNERIEELRQLAKEYNIEIYDGCELFLNDDYLEMIDQNLFNTLADSGYALCEFDVRMDIEYNNEAEDMLYEFMVRDLIPVIAHVERYFHKGVNLERVQEWTDAGYVIQVNRSSLTGGHGETSRKNAIKLLKAGLVHIVASDAHRAQGNRICKMSDAYAIIADIVGQKNANLLCRENPLHIIQNEEVEEMEVIKKKKSIFEKLKRR